MLPALAPAGPRALRRCHARVQGCAAPRRPDGRGGRPRERRPRERPRCSGPAPECLRSSIPPAGLPRGAWARCSMHRSAVPAALLSSSPEHTAVSFPLAPRRRWAAACLGRCASARRSTSPAWKAPRAPARSPPTPPAPARPRRWAGRAASCLLQARATGSTQRRCCRWARAGTHACARLCAGQPAASQVGACQPHPCPNRRSNPPSKPWSNAGQTPQVLQREVRSSWRRGAEMRHLRELALAECIGQGGEWETARLLACGCLSVPFVGLRRRAPLALHWALAPAASLWLTGPPSTPPACLRVRSRLPRHMAQGRRSHQGHERPQERARGGETRISLLSNGRARPLCRSAVSHGGPTSARLALGGRAYAHSTHQRMRARPPSLFRP